MLRLIEHNFDSVMLRKFFGNNISPGTAAGADLSKLNAFLLMFPPNQIDLFLKLTNHNLAESGNKPLTKSMLLSFTGIIVLPTNCGVRKQIRLW